MYIKHSAWSQVQVVVGIGGLVLGQWERLEKMWPLARRFVYIRWDISMNQPMINS